VTGLLPLAALVLVYLLVVGSVHPADAALGALVAGGARLAYRPLRTAGGGPARAPAGRGSPAARRLGGLLVFTGMVVQDVVAGTVAVARVVLARHPDPPAAFVRVPLGDRSPAAVALTSLAVTLSPGSVLVAVDWTEGFLLYHVLEAADPDAFRAREAALYRAQREFLP
jgi:multisubunit Na+/H+ antiporter MnhE subunit